MKRTLQILMIFVFVASQLDICFSSEPNIRLWSTEDGLSESNVFTVTMSPNNGVIANVGSSCCFYRLNGYAIEEYPFTNRLDKIPIYEDEKEQFWAVLRLDCFHQYDKNGKKWEKTNIKFSSRGYDIEIISSEKILYIDNDKILNFNSIENTTSTIFQLPDTDLKTLDQKISVPNIFQMPSKNVFAFSYKNIIKLNQTDNPLKWKSEIYPYPSNTFFPPFSIPIETSDGTLYVIMWNDDLERGELYAFKDNHWNLIYSKENWDINSGFIDKNKQLWLIRNDNLYRVNKEQQDIEPELIFVGSRYIVRDNNDVFFSTSKRGLLRYAPSLFESPPAMPNSKATVISISEDAHNRLWFMSNKQFRLYK
jgi:hypothetical protein